ncbi:GNAT family N-acetyltransferase [Synechococcus sp. CBW1107]|nr:GNAT family N-acetyltransferase [Synechococcus sp. CBW1107]
MRDLHAFGLGEPTSFPESFEHSRSDGGGWSWDLHLSRAGDRGTINREVEPLDITRIAQLEVPEDVAVTIGPASELPPRLFGLVRNGELLGVVDAIVQLPDVCALQQLFVTEFARGKGLAVMLVRAVADHMARQGRVSTYLVEAQNKASAAVARRAGFTLMERRRLWTPSV